MTPELLTAALDEWENRAAEVVRRKMVLAIIAGYRDVLERHEAPTGRWSLACSACDSRRSLACSACDSRWPCADVETVATVLRAGGFLQ